MRSCTNFELQLLPFVTNLLYALVPPRNETILSIFALDEGFILDQSSLTRHDVPFLNFNNSYPLGQRCMLSVSIFEFGK